MIVEREPHTFHLRTRVGESFGKEVGFGTLWGTKNGWWTAGQFSHPSRLRSRLWPCECLEEYAKFAEKYSRITTGSHIM